MDLIFRDDYPIRIYYAGSSELISGIFGGKSKIRKENNQLMIESLTSSVIIPAIETDNKNIKGFDIHLDPTCYIKETADAFKIEIKDTNEIHLGNTILPKNNCSKKSSPIY